MCHPHRYFLDIALSLKMTEKPIGRSTSFMQSALVVSNETNPMLLITRKTTFPLRQTAVTFGVDLVDSARGPCSKNLATCPEAIGIK